MSAIAELNASHRVALSCFCQIAVVLADRLPFDMSDLARTQKKNQLTGILTSMSILIVSAKRTESRLNTLFCNGEPLLC